ncbi:MAG: class I SAM-dependent methyltransferase [Bacteroidota bacterium]|nr:class I SAM-dependent methyltransferase [Bacteroidota bacterium]
MVRSLKAALQARYDAGENIEVVKRLVVPLVKDGMKVVDIGPGEGELVRYVADHASRYGLRIEIHAVDYLHSVLDRLPAGVRKHLFDLHGLAEEGSASNHLPFENGTFDLALFTEVIEHLTFPQVMVSELARILKPAGILVITTPNIFSLGNRLATLLGMDKLFRKVGEEGFVSTIEFNAFGHVAHYSPASLTGLLAPWFDVEKRTGSGFKVPVLRFFQAALARIFPNLANHIVLVARRKDIVETALRVVPCALTGAMESVLPDGRCLHPVPHRAVCHGCRHFHMDFLHPRDRRKKPSYKPS